MHPSVWAILFQLQTTMTDIEQMSSWSHDLKEYFTHRIVACYLRSKAVRKNMTNDPVIQCEVNRRATLEFAPTKSTFGNAAL